MSTSLLTALGAVVMAIGGYAIMRLRRHSVVESLCFGGGVLGMIILLSLIKYFLF